ncbi:efflux RND transporter periplasmic adaptor subunit [Cellulomonas soli]|uniref:MexH family multidrug efflux RND transporter periplasmic adaptor subunit n=1 Tax=Cellulomonas soli TaxID=931535 RepID=A0A512P8N9_9CELL|nr:secretion protein HlyD [Cellulomonas soli]NYI57789.1 biotin carboxyl carrier protein [Cellulomonas soli]GEP67573.1 MexH family multidrug efflux RND transporter periplasmic adaptor subunit [Cellulomonas soli]
MGVTRRIIFPTLRLLVWTVIAVALVKLAFAGADVSTADDALQPTGQVVEPTVQVTTGTVTNAVSVQAVVQADPATDVRATLAGTVSALLATPGQHVDAGTPLLKIRQETPQDPLVTTDPATGEQTTTERKPKVVVETVTAPIAGTLTLPTLKDQTVSVGDVLGSVAPGTLSVSGTLTPDQQYRLVGAPGEASVTLTGGPAPFTCTGLRLDSGATASTQQVADDGSSPSTGSTSSTVVCAVPGDVTAFPGLGATIEITNGTATDALVVPVTSVQGSFKTGNVWVVLPDGTQEERAVGLGLTDGENVQVTEGLAADDTILQFIPVPGGAGEVDCSDPAQYDPTVCGG